MLQLIFETIFLFTFIFIQAVESLEDNCLDQKCPSIDSVKEVDNNSCFIYLSPSSVKGGGMGIFSMKDFNKGDVILQSDGPNIPVIDPPHAKRRWGLFESYWWGEHSSLSPEMRFESRNIADYQITFGYVICGLCL